MEDWQEASTKAREEFKHPDDQKEIGQFEETMLRISAEEDFVKHMGAKMLAEECRSRIASISEQLATDVALIDNKTEHIRLIERKASYEWFLGFFDQDFKARKQQEQSAFIDKTKD